MIAARAPSLSDRAATAARLLGVAATALLCGAAVFLLTFALSWASLDGDRGALRQQVRLAFAAGDLDPAASWSFGNTDIGTHQFNDCLILGQALDDRAPRLERAISPLSVIGTTDNACGALAALADGKPAAAPHFYHHYVHAQTAVARLLIPALGVRGLRELYRLAISIVLLAGIGFAAIDLARGQRRATSAAWLVLFVAFARFSGFETFGQSLGHGPADLVVLGFLLFLSRASAQQRLARRGAIRACALFGALTMAFEMLTGGLPLGLALVIGAVPLALRGADVERRTIAEAAGAYLGAAVACLAAKFALVTATFGTAPLAETIGQALFRTGFSHAANRDQPAGWRDFFGKTWAGLDSLAPGLHWLVAGSLALAVAAGIWGYRRLRGDGDAIVRRRALALLGSNIVPLLWMVLLWQHTAEHAWFIDRILVWTIASGAALGVWGVMRSAAGGLREIGEPPHLAPSPHHGIEDQPGEQA